MDAKGGGWVMLERFGAPNHSNARSSLSLHAYLILYMQGEEQKTWVAMEPTLVE